MLKLCFQSITGEQEQICSQLIAMDVTEYILSVSPSKEALGTRQAAHVYSIFKDFSFLESNQ